MTGEGEADGSFVRFRRFYTPGMNCVNAAEGMTVEAEGYYSIWGNQSAVVNEVRDVEVACM